MRRETRSIREMLSRPVRVDLAMKVALALVGFGVAVTAAHSLAKAPAVEPARVEASTAFRPVILAIDWQEDEGAAHRSGRVAVAYAR